MRDVTFIIKRLWNFIWKEDSLLSWVVNIILAFVIVKFIIYPGLGFILGTSYPVVAVVSGSMEHSGYNFDDWWALNSMLYKNFNISKNDFSRYRFKNGFDKGDLMIIVGSDKIKKGDVVVFRGSHGEPIIHRAVLVDEEDEKFFVQTKGDNNKASRDDELNITSDRIIGVAKFRVPYLGWFKLGFLSLIGKA